ncbi:methionyl-tRNA formyltransferase [Robiginitalea sp. M366]|uniref:methionyl-tRNA formyltransferase n=1 Tax=Robiginitalea aestuariiviva TaxID=3036903 RepID=UPI00240E2CB4|nr:methionyl-tRNA formyltransferase [Robiginitalea aestuariiviva]MDG1572771.1 methionyl-tRNA formyltransferase [Robiginitalea aestuariiviva]
MKSLRIVFMGTPDFAVASLDALVHSAHTVVGVVTAPDRPAGRGRKLRPSAVKEYALEAGLPVLQPEKLKAPEFLEALQGLQADLQVVVAFRMLPEAVWAMPALGTFNLHASLLPQYRGAAPINWALINGETETGVTTFMIDHQIDTGQILLQRTTPIGPAEDAGALHDRLMALGAGLVVETTDRLADGTVQPQPQPEAGALRKAPKLFRENCRIAWDAPADTIHNLIRGLSPYPGAWTEFHNDGPAQQAKVFRAHPIPGTATLPPGRLEVREGKLLAHTANGILEMEELQLEGKKRMPVSDLLNGLEISNRAEFR